MTEEVNQANSIKQLKEKKISMNSHSRSIVEICVAYHGSKMPVPRAWQEYLGIQNCL